MGTGDSTVTARPPIDGELRGPTIAERLQTRDLCDTFRTEQRAMLEADITVLGLKRAEWDSMLDSPLQDGQWAVLKQLQRGHDARAELDRRDDTT